MPLCVTAWALRSCVWPCDDKHKSPQGNDQVTGLNHLRALTLYSGMSVLLAIDDHIADEVVTEQHQDPDVRAMLRLRDGDDSAIEELVERYQNELVGYFYHHCWDQLTAEDLAQTVFIKLYRARALSGQRQITHLSLPHRPQCLGRPPAPFAPHASLDAEMGSDGLRLSQALADGKQQDPADMDHRDYLRERIQEGR